MYRFLIDISSTRYDVNPIWSDGIKKEYAKEANQEFFREKLNGTLRFVREDYDLINNSPFSTLFTVVLQNDSSGTWVDDSEAYFYKTDCEFDQDAKIVTVNTQPKDRYDNIIAGMDKEFDLIGLAPEITPVSMVRQPLIQIYIEGSDFIDNYQGGVYYQQPVTEVIDTTNSSRLQNEFFFFKSSEFILIPGDSNELNPDVSGIYNYTTKVRLDGAYRIDETGPIPSIRELPSQTNIYLGGLLNPVLPDHPFSTSIRSSFGSLTPGGGSCQAFRLRVWSRVLSNQENLLGSPTNDIPQPDIVVSNQNYTKVLPLDLTDNIIHSFSYSTTPSRYGRYSENAANFPGEYFIKPNPVGNEQAYPISRSEWEAFSMWMYYDTALRDLQEDGAEDLTITQAYKISDVLSALLGEIDSNITYVESTTYSEFLHGTGSIRGGTALHPIITPKSNVVVGDYDQPAQKAPIKLSEVFALLWYFHKCKWYIDDNNRLRIEHIHFFKNGLSYDSQQVGANLTTQLEPKTGKTWGYWQNKYKFDKSKLPERFEFSWMDDTSIPFDGFPIDIRSVFVDKGNIENWTIGRFTSDVDFIQSNPAEISKEGFVFFEATESSGVYSLPFVELTVGDETFKVQNGYAAFMHAHPQYHKYFLPATDITINEEDTTATTTIRTKQQEVEFASVEPDPMQLITTGLGTGEVEGMEITLSNGTIKIQVAHDTE